MKSNFRWRLLAAPVFSTVILLAITLQVSAAEITAVVKPEEGRLEWSFDGQKLLTYAFASNQFKPYVKELYTLAGDNVLRDAPADHLHHHGLMYAIRVNGVNFWEEVGEAGHERSIELLSQSTGKSTAGLPQASFTQLIHWVRDADKVVPDTAPVALLVEKRTLTITVDKANQEVALEWRGEFEVGHGAPKVKLHGSEYNGLGLRLPQAFDHVARHQNSDNVPYTRTNNRDVIAAKWSTVSHKLDGHEIMVALFAQPGSVRGDTKFFSMLDPFTYLSVTQGLDKAPLEYSAGEKFSVDYLVTVYPAFKSAEFLQRRHQLWEKSSAAANK
ncbi:MAG: PmoA family protein [Verrucomicrobia bacterium]|nr:PmoA family protein [Verrucomicrobiota bacterium]